jgi:hypothetical protein
MSTLTLWHGSVRIIERPVYGAGKTYNDYGKGFYCTEHPALAGEWAVSERTDGYINAYELNAEGLNILNLNSQEYHILHWLALLMNYRRIRLSTPVMRRGAQWLADHYLIDLGGVDIVRGYRADDSYFSFARSFVNNEISLQQLASAMRLGKLGEQIVLKSPKAFDRIHFVSYELADHTGYYILRKQRDLAARSDWQKLLEMDDEEGLYIRDLMRLTPDEDELKKISGRA